MTTPIQRPPWHEDHSLTPEQATILTALDDLRTDRPVLWAMVMGKTTSHSIAKYLAYPQDWVLIILRGYKKNTIVTDHETPKWGMVWIIADDEKELWGLRAWVVQENRPAGLFNPA